MRRLDRGVAVCRILGLLRCILKSPSILQTNATRQARDGVFVFCDVLFSFSFAHAG